MIFKIISFSIFFIGFLINSSSAQAVGRNDLYPQCSTANNFTANSTFESNLKTLLSALTSNLTANLHFYNTTVGHGGNTVYGLFMCLGSMDQERCRNCVGNSTIALNETCRFSKEAVNWRDPCLVRYSDRNFFSMVATRPRLRMLNTNNVSNQAGFMNVLRTIMNTTANEAAKPGLMKTKFGTNATTVEFQTLYVLVQCTPDISSADCRRCLGGVIGDFSWCCDGKIGGRVLYPSCLARYELYKFFDFPSTIRPIPLPPPPALFSPLNPAKRRHELRTIVIAVVTPVGAVVLLCLAYCLLKNQIKKIRMAFLMKKYFGSERNTLEPLQFSLATIEAATNKFSKETSLGQGGFGQVYKGILSNGREIAVKRLSKSSDQGADEFKNEVLLIARLQHRNLVALLGFCIEGQEKILIYEYIPNKSLDYFLFGSEKSKLLDWEERYKIIGGVARGILCLHDYSRVKIIHRDLKPSNILLDDEMNPKISDFGMARMVGINEIDGNTSKIVGTYGYMSPEYAMFGQYSEKSDVFSFGVILLEIISGQKITSHAGQSQGLLNYAWNQWKEEKVLEILDSNLNNESESYDEVNKCVQIGLLCVQEDPEARPSMATVVSYLSNDSIQLPFPQEPAFFLEGHMGQLNTEIKESINDITISDFHPR